MHGGIAIHYKNGTIATYESIESFVIDYDNMKAKFSYCEYSGSFDFFKDWYKERLDLNAIEEIRLT